MLIDWIPVLWKSDDWDWSYILLIWAHKLKRQRECILRNSIIEDAQKVHDQMKVCEDALRRLSADDYNSAGWIKHHEKWPFRIIRREDGSSYTPSMTDEEEVDFRALLAIEDAAREADEKLFMNTFLENYRGWWD